MGSFKQFLKEQEFIRLVEDTFSSLQRNVNLEDPFDARPLAQTSGSKVWSAKKDEILAMWRQLRSNLPILITPMEKKGDEYESYGEDGIRLTGSWNFIASVLGRLKDLISYESPQTKLRLIFRGIDHWRDARPDRQTFVFYLNVERRSHGKPGRRKGAVSSIEPVKPITGMKGMTYGQANEA